MTVLNGQTITAVDIKNLLRTFSTAHIAGATAANITYTDTNFDIATGSSTSVYVQLANSALQVRAVTSDWASANAIHSRIIFGGFLYLLLKDVAGTTIRVYRYSASNIAAGGTLMTISGQAFSTSSTNVIMQISDTGVFYFSCKAGNSASFHVISKYTLSGTTLTYVSDITCGSTSSNFTSFIRVDGSTNFYGYGSDKIIRKYNSAGTLQTTGASAYAGQYFYFMYDVLFIDVGDNITFSRIDLP